MKIQIFDYHRYCLEYKLLSTKILSFFKINNIECDIYVWERHWLNEEFINRLHQVDFIFVNSCIGWDKNISSTYNIIHNIFEQNKNITIFLFWCTTHTHNLKYKNNEKLMIIPLWKEYLIDEYFNLPIKIKDISDFYINNLLDIWKWRHLHREQKFYYLNISRWCIHNCSFCNTKKAIWYVKSKNLQSIIEEVESALKLNYNEIVIVSDDLWSYWLDIWSNYIELLKQILSISEDFLLHIDYIEPSTVINNFDNFKLYLNRISYICIPVQSFNDRILSLMNRKYIKKDYLNVILEIRKINPNIKLSNHLIFAYPTEKEIDFLDYFNYINLFDITELNEYSHFNNTANNFIESDFIDKKTLLKYKIILIKKKLQFKNKIKYI